MSPLCRCRRLLFHHQETSVGLLAFIVLEAAARRLICLGLALASTATTGHVGGVDWTVSGGAAVAAVYDLPVVTGLHEVHDEPEQGLPAVLALTGPPEEGRRGGSVARSVVEETSYYVICTSRTSLPVPVVWQ